MEITVSTFKKNLFKITSKSHIYYLRIPTVLSVKCSFKILRMALVKAAGGGHDSAARGGKAPNDVITRGKRWHGAKVVLHWKWVLKGHHCWRRHIKKESLFLAAQFRSHIRNRRHENSAVLETTRLARLCFRHLCTDFDSLASHLSTEAQQRPSFNLWICSFCTWLRCCPPSITAHCKWRHPPNQPSVQIRVGQLIRSFQAGCRAANIQSVCT